MNPDPYVYAANNYGPRKWAKEVLDTFRPFTSTCSQIIDIGCGTGEVTNMLIDKFPGAQITALDKLQTMIEYAQDNNANDSIEYETSDIQENQPKLWNSKYDFVFSFLCLQWVDDQVATLTNIKKMMSKDGEVLFVMGTKPSESFLRLTQEIKELSRWKPYLEKFYASQWNTSKTGMIRWRIPDPLSGYSSLLRDHGFNIISAKQRPFEYVVESDEKCKGMLEFLMPQAPVIPEDLRSEFMDDAFDIFMKYCEKTDSGLSVWRPNLLVFHCQISSD